MLPELLESQTGPVLTLSLNRPERRNALSLSLVTRLADRLEQAGRDTTVSTIVLSGEGHGFCAGADLSEIGQVESSKMASQLDEFHRMIRAIAVAPQPVIARVDGAAAGFGADLALCCDLRVLSTRAYFQEAFISIGLMPDGGSSFWLPALVGYGRAFELLALGERWDAHSLLAFGVAQRVVPPELLDETADELARRLARSAPLALRAIKRALRAGQAEALDAALAREKAGQLALLQSADFQEGLLAFREKRAPVFRGA